MHYYLGMLLDKFKKWAIEYEDAKSNLSKEIARDEMNIVLNEISSKCDSILNKHWANHELRKTAVTIIEKVKNIKERIHNDGGQAGGNKTVKEVKKLQGDKIDHNAGRPMPGQKAYEVLFKIGERPFEN